MSAASRLNDMTSVELYEWRSRPFKAEIAQLQADNERLRSMLRLIEDAARAGNVTGAVCFGATGQLPIREFCGNALEGANDG